jgi:hypothetical protein
VVKTRPEQTKTKAKKTGQKSQRKTHYKHPTKWCQKTSQKTQNLSPKTAKPQQQKTKTEPANNSRTAQLAVKTTSRIPTPFIVNTRCNFKSIRTPSP